MKIYELNTTLSINKDLIEAPNLCDRFDDEDLTTIGSHIYQGYQRDLSSRSVWERRNEAGMDLAMQIQKDKNFPWPGCANIIFPLITIAAVQFSSRSYSNIVTGYNVVKQLIGGPDPLGQLQERADRIGSHMSWQVLKENKAWEEEHDRLFINLAIVGTNFIKSYFSPSKGHNVTDLVQARDLIIDYWAKSVEDCARKTHRVPLYRNQVYERVRQGLFRDVLSEAWFSSPPPATSSPQTAQRDNRTGVVPPQPDEDTPFETLEQHKLLDLDKDGYAEPYIVTIEKSSQKVLRIVARIEREEDVERVNKRIIRIKSEEYFTKFGFIPAPDGSIYDVGFGTLVGPLNEGVNTAINQIFDCGTMQNSNGGLLGRGAKIRGGSYTFAPWEWKRVDSTGDDLRKSMVPLPIREPSTVMFQLLGLLINYTDRLGGTVDTMVGENPGQNTKTGVANQTLEQGMQVYSSIFKRIWRSMGGEFQKLANLNRQFLPIRSQFGAKGHFILQEDYKQDVDQICPVADPRLLSDTQRVQQAQLLCERASMVAGYDLVQTERNLLTALRIDGIDKFYPGPEKLPPQPDAKAQAMMAKVKVEEARLQLESARLQLDEAQFKEELEETRRVNSAKIAQLEAQAQDLMVSSGLAQGDHQLKVYQAAIDSFIAHNQVITDRISALAQKKASERAPATAS